MYFPEYSVWRLQNDCSMSTCANVCTIYKSSKSSKCAVHIALAGKYLVSICRSCALRAYIYLSSLARSFLSSSHRFLFNFPCAPSSFAELSFLTKYRRNIFLSRPLFSNWIINYTNLMIIIVISIRQLYRNKPKKWMTCLFSNWLKKSLKTLCVVYILIKYIYYIIYNNTIYWNTFWEMCVHAIYF